ncbi:inactive beta-amylase 9, partial [Asparagus officinalis]|uniref:inactive beta-amylase 9 n=1 Tax=Asparagus officinalis TaxID=4686 RepID=UPI00098E7A5E
EHSQLTNNNSWPVSVGLKAVRSEISVVGKKSAASKNSASPNRLFVGLPLDSVSDCNTINHTKAISAGLRALKLLGVQGVELPIQWSIAQPESTSEYCWSSYLALARVVQDAGLELRVGLHLYGSKKSRQEVCLPKWVKRIAMEKPDILFTDRAGQRHAGCLSFAVDELPVLDGKTPMQVFEEFFLSFQGEFSGLIGSTITGILVGLGPDGELRYPSYPPTTTTTHPFTGVGEFQCYDKFLLANLKSHAENSGNPCWGLSGPHDAPSYNESPNSTNFFNDQNGSWDSPYGKFFLSWYSNQLLSHGDRLLSIASKSFANLPITLSAKIPLLHNWHKTRSRPAELTAGYFNGYVSVAETFGRHSCQMVVSGMDLVDKDQPEGLQSSPELLLDEIIGACKRNGVRISGENSRLVGWDFGRIKEKLSVVGSFTYQRMGADFFSPQHFFKFAEFVRSMKEIELGVDDLASEEETLSMGMEGASSGDREMQAA